MYTLPPHPRRTALALALAALPWNVMAEEITPLPPVTVTAPALTDFEGTVLNGDTLRASTVRDSARLLTEIPGVSVNPAGGISSLPAIHGLADDRLRLTVDGADLIASCPNHMNAPLSYVDPAQIEEIRVYSGIAPVSAGGDALGAVVQVETRGPAFAKPGERLLKGRLGASYGSNANVRGVNASAVLANDSLSLAYTGAASQADNYTAGSDFKTYDFSGRAGHTLPRDEVGSTAYKAVNHQLGLGWKSGEHLLEAKFAFQDVPYQLYPNQRMDMLDNTEHRMSLRYVGRFHWGELEARLYRQTVNHAMDFGADKRFYYGFLSGGPGAPVGTACGQMGNNCAWGMPMYTESRTTGGRVKAELALTARDLLRVGGEFQRYRLDDWWPPSGAGMWPGSFWNINDGKRDRVGMFGEWERQWDGQWKTLAGLRYEQVKTDTGPVVGYARAVMGNQLRDADLFNARDHARTFNDWDVSLLARYTPSATQDIEFGFARKTRAPSLYELYPWSTWSMAAVMNNFLGDGNGYIGNPDLKAEKAHTLSATFDWHAGDRAWEFKATPYYTRVTDYIDAIQWNAAANAPATTLTTQQFVTLKYVNQTARLYGIDLSGKLPLAHNALGDWGLKGLLAYTNGKNLDTGDDLYNIMPLNARLALTQKLGRWDNGVEVVAVRRKDAVSDVRNELKTPGYGLVNLRASYAFKQARLDFGVENLFDRFYFLPTGGAYVGQGTTMAINPSTQPKWGTPLPGMGRNFYAAVTLDF
ncbi:TonB-dependent receptor [Thiobacter aerophilum]|uniref:TonB-dependent receptor n=1 Tax=Thiobacter aerophilum TaxID=3121275 RepID=A0ABV0EE28_9BURK